MSAAPGPSGAAAGGGGAAAAAPPGAPPPPLALAPEQRPEQLADEAWLYNAPTLHGALAWSEDNLIAAATGHEVAILSAADLEGPRHFVSLPPPRPGGAAALAGCHPRAAPESPSLVLALLSEAEAGGGGGGAGGSGGAGPRAAGVAWSPAGAAGGGGCLLAVLSSDRVVRVYGPGATPLHSRWRVRRDLTEVLQAHLATAGWGDADPPPGGGGGAAGAALRLRGGGRKKAAPTKGGAGKRGDGEGEAGGGSDGGGEAAAAAGNSKKRPRAPELAAAPDAGAAAPGAAAPKRGRLTKKGAAGGAGGSAAAAASPGAGATARAARAAELFGPGSEVEVMNDEPGLQGCWFTGRCVVGRRWGGGGRGARTGDRRGARAAGHRRGADRNAPRTRSRPPHPSQPFSRPRRVERLEGDFILVVYDELFSDEASTSRLSEWFPLPPPLRGAGGGGAGGALAAAAGALQGGDAVHDGSRDDVVRPKPPAEVRGGPAPGALRCLSGREWGCNSAGPAPQRPWPQLTVAARHTPLVTLPPQTPPSAS
jgi:hypothetical protein